MEENTPQSNAFLPEGYEPPATGGGYLKFKTGATKFRVLSSPIMGFEAWTNESKPHRWRSKPEAAELVSYKKQQCKHFWALIVWSYEDNELMVLQLTQVSIINAITTLAKDPAWGSPFNYDLTVNKVGTDLETKYTLMPNPPSLPSPEMTAAAMEIEDTIDLNKLYDGDSPFID